MIPEFDEAIALSPYSVPQPLRDRLLLAGLNRLTKHHYDNCLPYRRIIDGSWEGRCRVEQLKDLPYLPVGLFKSLKLQSVPDKDVRVTMTSSGTTGQSVSRIMVDSETSLAQQRALAKSLMHVLGAKRLPMLVIDTDAVFKDPAMISARGAGVLGLMRYGHHHAFALDRNLEPDVEAVEAFLKSYGSGPFFMFGFTFMVWVHFFQKFRDLGFDLSNGILIHSGGWKKMTERAVNNDVFRSELKNSLGITKIYNFYGMVEQIGSIFLEGPDGLLYPPNISDVVIRNPDNWQPCAVGEPGVIQVISLLPHSYPGHSLLTEDIGVIEAIDAGRGEWMGKGLRIIGRVPRSELRGCSDVLASV